MYVSQKCNRQFNTCVWYKNLGKQKKKSDAQRDTIAMKRMFCHIIISVIIAECVYHRRRISGIGICVFVANSEMHSEMEHVAGFGEE